MLYGVQFGLTNIGTTAFSNAIDYALAYDAQGHNFYTEMTSTISSGPSFPSPTQLAPKATAQGWVVFAIPRGDAVTRVQLSLDSGFVSTGEWAVS